MNISEAISRLQKLQKEHGDIPVVVWDTIDNEITTDLVCFSVLEDARTNKPIHLLLADKETAVSFS